MILHSADIIKGMSAKAIDAIIGIAEEIPFDTGEVVFKQGDPADHLFVLEDGVLQLIVTGVSRSSLVVQNPGDIVGWSSVAGRDAYSATAQCIAPTKLIRIHQAKLEKILQQHPVDGLLFYKQLTGAVGERLVRIYQDKAFQSD